jgi:putative effector of murein hydrolase
VIGNPRAVTVADRFEGLVSHLLATPLLAVVLTLGAYAVSRRIVRLFGSPAWCPPVAIAASIVAAALAVLAIDYEDYQRGASWIIWLLGPATVALGVPLYQQFHHIRALWQPILLTVPVAATLAAVYAVGLAWWLGASPDVLASLAPKSVTAPIAVGITEQIGGSLSLMMGGLLITGVASIIFVELLVKQFKVTDERVIGLMLGINGHAIGTVRAFEISATAGAFSSLGMSLTGVFTAIWLPIVWGLLEL